MDAGDREAEAAIGVSAQGATVAHGAVFARPALVLVTDTARLRGRHLAGVVDAAIAGGVSVVQLRDRDAPQEDLLRQARELRDVTGGRALFLVNSAIDAALSAQADGVHLPEQSGSVAAARARIASSMLISRAVHGVDAARYAERDGVDLVQAGTVFVTGSKPGAATLGTDGLRAICEAVRIPVIAIGGITPENAASVIASGADGVAVIGAIFDAPDPRDAAASLRAALDAAAVAASVR